MYVARQAGLHGDDGQVVRRDVVQLACDADAFEQHGPLLPVALLALELAVVLGQHRVALHQPSGSVADDRDGRHACAGTEVDVEDGTSPLMDVAVHQLRIYDCCGACDPRPCPARGDREERELQARLIQAQPVAARLVDRDQRGARGHHRQREPAPHHQRHADRDGQRDGERVERPRTGRRVGAGRRRQGDPGDGRGDEEVDDRRRDRGQRLRDGVHAEHRPKLVIAAAACPHIAGAIPALLSKPLRYCPVPRALYGPGGL